MLLSELTLFAVCFKQLLFGGFSGYVTVARGAWEGGIALRGERVLRRAVKRLASE